jgi:hypothetical protein
MAMEEEVEKTVFLSFKVTIDPPELAQHSALFAFPHNGGRYTFLPYGGPYEIEVPMDTAANGRLECQVNGVRYGEKVYLDGKGPLHYRVVSFYSGEGPKKHHDIHIEYSADPVEWSTLQRGCKFYVTRKDIDEL